MKVDKAALESADNPLEKTRSDTGTAFEVADDMGQAWLDRLIGGHSGSSVEDIIVFRNYRWNHMGHILDNPCWD